MKKNQFCRSESFDDQQPTSSDPLSLSHSSKTPKQLLNTKLTSLLLTRNSNCHSQIRVIFSKHQLQLLTLRLWALVHLVLFPFLSVWTLVLAFDQRVFDGSVLLLTCSGCVSWLENWCCLVMREKGGCWEIWMMSDWERDRNHRRLSESRVNYLI